MSKSPIQLVVSMRLIKASVSGRTNDGTHKQSFSPETEASYTIRTSVSPLGTAKYLVRLFIVPGRMYPFKATFSSLLLIFCAVSGSLSRCCGRVNLGGFWTNQGGCPSLTRTSEKLGQRQKKGVEPMGHSHQVAPLARQRQSLPTSWSRAWAVPGLGIEFHQGPCS